MSESTVTEHPEAEGGTPVPPFDPDDELMADLEGRKSAVAAYKRQAASLRAAASRD